MLIVSGDVSDELPSLEEALSTLAGKAQAYGTQAGSIFVNGRPDRLERYKRVMGFVPQVGSHC